MKENVLDVLRYLFENYRAAEVTDAHARERLRDELSGAGFLDAEIRHALLKLMPLPVLRPAPRRVLAAASARLH